MSSNTDAADPLPPPNAIGAPSKFDRWRHLQAHAVLAAVSTDRRFVVQAMPTGSGKSLVYMSQATLTGARTCILTSTKGLQEQLTRDFTEVGLLDIRGMGNYPCRILQEGDRGAHGFSMARVFGQSTNTTPTNCDHGPCTVGEQCVYKEGGCGYYDQLRHAQRSQLVVTNYAYWLHNQSYGGPKNSLGSFDLLVLDEAHDAPDNLSDFLTVELEAREIEQMLDTRLLDPASAPDAWAEWARYHAARAQSRYEALAEEIKRLGKAPGNLRREARDWKMLAGKLNRLAEMKADWIAEAVGRGMKFCPIWPSGYAERFLFRGIKKVVLVSATIRPKTAEYLGIAPGDMEFCEYPSTFPLQHRPVIHVPTVQMNFRTEKDPATIRQMVNRVDQIIGRRLDRKGIIHTHSYRRAMDIYQNSDHAHLMIRPAADNTRRMVEEFKRAPAPRVLISPAVTTGYDFPYDECEYQILVKLPIPDTRPQIMKARNDSDQAYGPYLTMQTLVQAVGRGMRAADDQCETFILDNNIRWFIWKNKQYAPAWFLDSYQEQQTLTAPMGRVGRKASR